MFRIRFHGRGGQGIKTAARILGTAFFTEGWEVQDAPRYGAERRGAPISAYVRAARHPINERGIVLNPDLVVVADETLVPVPAAAVCSGLTDRSVLLIATDLSPEVWNDRLKSDAIILTVPLPEIEDLAELPFVAAASAAAAACVTGVIPEAAINLAIREELAGLSPEIVQKNIVAAETGYLHAMSHAGIASEGSVHGVTDNDDPNWVTLPHDDASRASPAIHASATSVEVRTGLWRTLRPVIDYDRCNRCNWVCGTFCPDSAINVDERGYPVIDLDHCKGCMICVAQCPPHAIEAIPEREAAEAENEAAI